MFYAAICRMAATSRVIAKIIRQISIVTNKIISFRVVIIVNVWLVLVLLWVWLWVWEWLWLLEVSSILRDKLIFGLQIGISFRTNQQVTLHLSHYTKSMTATQTTMTHPSIA